MAQQAKYIDITRTYLPIDPDSLPMTEHATQAEDAPEQRFPVMPYEGYNFMPTQFGYRSYFGFNSYLDDDIPSSCDQVIAFQQSNYQNMLLAFCKDGIYQKMGVSPFTQIISATVPSDAPVYKLWTWCVIEDVLYIYREGEDHVSTISRDGTVSSFAPSGSVINMAGQIGIFKAGGRLAFWDSDDAFSWSAYTDRTDFLPQIATQANVGVRFRQLIGKVTMVQQHGKGFIIYATKSIIYISQKLDNVFGWTDNVLSNTAGVAFWNQVAVGNPDTVHYSWTSVGLFKIDNGQAEIVAQEFWDYLSQMSSPVSLRMLEGRYLFINVVDGDYVFGQIGSSVGTFSIGGPGSTDYDALNALLTDVGLESVSARDIGTLMRSWSLTDATANKIGATLFAGSVIGLEDGESYPDDFVGAVSRMILPIGGAGAAGLTFTASTLNFSATDELTLVDGTAISIHLYDGNVSDDEPARPASLVGIGDNGLLYQITGNDVTENTLEIDNWGSYFETSAALAYPEYVFPAATMYWEMELGWMRDRLRALNSYLEHTLGPQVITLAIAISNYADPPIYMDYTTEVVYLRTVDNENDLGLAAMDVLPFSSFTRDLGSVAVPRRLGEPNYGFSNETLYMFKNIVEATKYTMQVTGICEVEDPGTYLMAAIGTYASLNGTSYATTAAAVAACDALVPAEAPHMVRTATTPNAWSRYIQQADADFGSVLIMRNVTAAIRADYSIRNRAVDVPNCDFAPIALVAPSSHSIWDEASSTWSADGSWTYTPPSVSCTVAEERSTFRGLYIPNPMGDDTFAGLPIPDITVDDVDITVPDPEEPDFPSGTFNLQDGIPAPIYPTYAGAYVYDSHYKKWGKMKKEFMTLMDFNPINTLSGSLLAATRFGVVGAAVNLDGTVQAFDANPSDSYIKFGKFGLFRFGMTTLEELILQFGLVSTGSVDVETSLDGKSTETALTKSTAFSAVKNTKVPVGNTGNWHNIVVRGQYDLTYMQPNAYRVGRR